MKQFFSLLSLLFFSLLLNAQGKICVQNGSTAVFTSKLDSAIILAQTGAIIYLPGGSVSGTTTTVNITKKVTIIGAGYHPDSSLATMPTKILPNLNFNTGSEGTHITGLQVNGITTITVSNIRVTRSYFKKDFTINNNCANIHVNESIFEKNFRSPTAGNNPNMFVTNSIFYDQIAYLGSVTFINNIFLYSTGTTPFYATTFCSFENNIITTPSISGANSFGTNNDFTNNLFVTAGVVGSNTSSNNIFSQTLSNIFVSYNGATTWSKSNNFQLQATCLGKNGGSDGTDMGIYGGTGISFKAGGKPFNPHIQSANIPASSGPNGTLNINIKVNAEQN